jgi:hypothetical protein
VAIQTYLVGWFSQLSIVFRAVRVVATETCDPTPIHNTLHEVIALHPIFVGGALREMRKTSHAQSMVFQFPEILQL